MGEDGTGAGESAGDGAGDGGGGPDGSNEQDGAGDGGGERDGGGPGDAPTYEVEVKVRADHDRIRDRLSELGGERIDRVEQVDTYYDAPHRDFAETDEALRIREQAADDETIHELAYKGPKVDEGSKTRREADSAVDDPGGVDAALRELGFEPAATVEKERERYRLGGYLVALDAVDGLGEFVEVERAAREGDLHAVRDGARDLLADLGLEPDAQVRTSYLGLLRRGDE